MEITYYGRTKQVTNATEATDEQINALLPTEDLDSITPIEDEDNEPYSCKAWAVGEDFVLVRENDNGDDYWQMLPRAGWTMEDHIGDWNWDELGYARKSEWMAAWGYNGLAYEAVATPEHEGPCLVYCEPNYYQGHINAPKPHMVHEEDADGQTVYDADGPVVREFADYAEAKAYVDAYYDAPSGYDGIRACSVLSHGQSGPDTLTIVNA